MALTLELGHAPRCTKVSSRRCGHGGEEGVDTGAPVVRRDWPREARSVVAVLVGWARSLPWCLIFLIKVDFSCFFVVTDWGSGWLGCGRTFIEPYVVWSLLETIVLSFLSLLREIILLPHALDPFLFIIHIKVNYNRYLVRCQRIILSCTTT